MKTWAMMLLLIPFSALATTYYVNAEDGLDTNSGLTSQDSKQSLQSAINCASDGDTIRVSQGTYSPIVVEKRIEIIGESPSTTIIDAKKQARCAMFGGQDEYEIRNFTLRNGYLALGHGAGVSGGTLSNCVIEACDAMPRWQDGSSSAGGAFQSKLYDCVVQDCRADDGGGVRKCVLHRCIIRRNYAGSGGGVHDSTIYDSLIVSNTACLGSRGGGVIWSRAYNCTVVGNKAEGTDGDGFGGGGFDNTEAYNCISYDNSAYIPENNNKFECSVWENCFDSDPKFVDAPNGNYQLLPNSPCRDAGDNDQVTSSCDLNRGARIVGGVVDIGCYEYSEPLYKVIDLSGGSSAIAYPVTYLTDVPVGGWSDEYKTTKLVMRRIEPGTCVVTVDKPYYAGVFEVTQKQYELVTGKTPSRFVGEEKRPVECVSYDTIRGSDKGSQYPSSTDVDADSFVGRLRLRTGLQVDLPTEAQWEYASRAGATTSFFWGYGANEEYMWYSGNSDSHPHEVGTREPNAWGLYDVHGNVFEKCLEWYYTGHRVLRGGGWYDGDGGCNFNYRAGVSSTDVNDNIGFRLFCNFEESTFATVIFNPCGGEVSESTRQVALGSAVGPLPIPTRDGYQFLGWFTAQSGGVEISSVVCVSEDTEYYAHWQVLSQYEWATDLQDDSSVFIVGVSPRPKGRLEIPSVVGGKKVVGIGWGALQGDWGDPLQISELIIPEGITNIQPWAFGNSWESSHSIVHIELPSTLIGMEVNPFIGSLSDSCEITIASGNPKFRMINGHVVNSANCLVVGTHVKGIVSVPDCVVEIGESAFRSNESIKEVSIPDSVKIIRACAFDYCNALSSVTLPSSLEWIGSYIFEGSAITELTFPASVSYAYNTCMGMAKLQKVIFEGNAPSAVQTEFFDGVPNTAIVRVRKGTVGWAQESNPSSEGLPSSGYWPCNSSSYGRQINWYCEVNFRTNGGETPDRIIKVDYGDCYPSVTDPVWADHCFAGWHRDPIYDWPVDFSSRIYDHQECFAHWVQIQHYATTIGFNTGLDDWHVDTRIIAEMASTYLPGFDGSRAGYDFVGWIDNNGKEYSAGDEIVAPGDHNLSLTMSARWSPHWYRVFWGGSDSSTTCKYDLKYAAPSNNATKTGYSFECWKHLYGESRIDKIPNGGIFCNLTTNDQAEIWFDREWSPIRYALSFCANGGEGAMADTNVVYDSSVILPCATFSRRGYRFSGWALSDLAGLPEFPDCAVVSNLTDKADGRVVLYAVWDLVDYPIAYAGTREMSNDNPKSYTVNDTIVFGALSNTGCYEFVTWEPNGIQNGTTGDVAVVAQWRKIECADVLTNVQSHVSYGGDAEWQVDWNNDRWTLRSGEIAKKQTSWIQMNFTGSAKVAFDWKVSCENRANSDYLTFLIDDVEQERIYGEHEWSPIAINVNGSGEHKVEWLYHKDKSTDEGLDCGWIRDVSITPIVSVAFDGNGHSKGVSPSPLAMCIGESLLIPARGEMGKDKHEFIGWKYGDAIYQPGDDYVVTGAVVFTAQWIRKDQLPPLISVVEVFDDVAAEVTITPPEGSQVYYTIDGSEPSASNGILYSGAFTVNATTTISAVCVRDDYFDSAVSTKTTTSIYCPANITFDIGDASGVAPADIPTATNRVVLLPGVGEAIFPKHNFACWRIGEELFLPGDEYAVTGSVAVIAVWTEKRLSTPVVSVASYYTDAYTIATVESEDDGVTLYYMLDDSGYPEQYHGSIYVYGSHTISAYAVKDDYFDSEVSAPVQTTRAPYTAQECLNCDGLYFYDDGDQPWVRDLEESHDGQASMRSGAIDDAQTSVLSAYVYDDGRLTFWCKTSSEDDADDGSVYDGLQVYVDGEPQFATLIGGERGWQQFEVSIAGETYSHLIEWSYEKDNKDCAGADCVWLDNVEWTPAQFKCKLLDDGTAEITSYLGDSTVERLIVPSECNGRVVTRISDYAFASCQNLSDVQLPETIVELPRSAFNSLCPLMCRQGYGAEIVYIGSWAVGFKTCILDDDIELSGDIVYGDYQNVPKLDVLIDAGTKRIASGAFRSIYLAHAGDSWSCVEYWVPYGQVSFPQGLLSIGEEAFGSGWYPGSYRAPDCFIPETIEMLGDYSLSGLVERNIVFSGEKIALDTLPFARSYNDQGDQISEVYYIDGNSGWVYGESWCGVNTYPILKKRSSATTLGAVCDYQNQYNALYNWRGAKLRLRNYVPDDHAVAIPVYGATSVAEIKPVIIHGSTDDDYLPSVEVLTDADMYNSIVLPVLEFREDWEDNGDRIQYSDDLGRMEAEWSKAIWPDASICQSRHWIVARPSGDKYKWAGVNTFRIGLAGTDEVSERIYLLRESMDYTTVPSEAVSPDCYFNRMEISGCKYCCHSPDGWMYVDHDEHGENGTYIGFHNFCFENQTTNPVSMTVKLPSAGTLVMTSWSGDDEIDKDCFVLSGNSVVSDEESVFGPPDWDSYGIDWSLEDAEEKYQQYEQDYEEWRSISYWKYNIGWNPLVRRVKVSAATELTFSHKWDEDIDVGAIKFFPEGAKSVAINAGWISARKSGASSESAFAYRQGYVTGAGTYVPGERAVLVAKPGAGEYFDHWEVKYGSLPEDINLNSPTLEIPITESMCGGMEDEKQITVRAIWKEKSVVDVITSPIGAATMTGARSACLGDQIEITLELNEGFEFVRWIDGDQSGVTRTFTINDDGTDRPIYAILRRVYSDPIPDLGDNPSAAEISAALDGAADNRITSYITNATDYVSFAAWSKLVRTSDGLSVAGAQAVKDSPTAWLSFALNTSKLIAGLPQQDDVKISEFTPTTEGSFEMTVKIDGIEIGSDASKENLKRIFGLEGATSLDSKGSFSSDNVDIVFGTPVNGKVKFTAVPKVEAGASFFMKVKVNP